MSIILTAVAVVTTIVNVWISYPSIVERYHRHNARRMERARAMGEK